MTAQQAIEGASSCGQLWWLGVLFGGLMTAVVVASLLGAHFSRREGEIWENGHEAGYDSAVRAHREGRLR